MAPSGQAWPSWLDPAASAAAAAENWVVECCRVEVDADGNVVTPLPALMAAAVGQLVEEAAAADAAPHSHPPRREPTRLHGCRPPGISVEDYASRLLRYCKNSPVCYAAAFAYMLRLHRGAPGVRGGRVRVDTLTAHRMMAVGSVVACKFYDDKFFSNHHYAQVAGVSLAEWNAMELDLLFRLGFRARVGVEELHAALREMLALAGARHASLLPPEPRPATCALSCSAPAAADAGEDSASSADTVVAPFSASHPGSHGGFLVSWGMEDAAEGAACSSESVLGGPAALPWAAASPAGCGGQPAAPSALLTRHSKRRCSSEASQRQHFGEQQCLNSACRA